MDIISIHKLRVDTLIGAHAWEKRVKQTVVIDLDYANDTMSVADTDNLTHTQDYTSVTQAVCEFLSDHQAQLIETLAAKLADFLQETFKLTWFRLRIFKPHVIANTEGVSITVERP